MADSPEYVLRRIRDLVKRIHMRQKWHAIRLQTARRVGYERISRYTATRNGVENGTA